jgi:hypothetical protein
MMNTVSGRPPRRTTTSLVALLALAMLAMVGGLTACGTAAPSPVSSSSAPGRSAAPSSAATSPASQPPGSRSGGGPVRPDHIVVVVFENKAADQIEGNPAAPYLNSLMTNSAVLTDARAITHPSQPNYLALFSGSTQNVTDDHCPLNLGDRPNLGRQLIDAGLTFVGYSEGLPAVGYAGCSSGRYAAKHSPWVNFSNLPGAVNQPATSFPSDYSKLPTVAFLIPDLCNDMHDCSIATGDSWSRDHLDPYVQWAREHSSLLVVTFDEDDQSAGNRVLTFIAGASIQPGRYAQPVSHYGLLSTVEGLYGLNPLGSAATAPPIVGIWR